MISRNYYWDAIINLDVKCGSSLLPDLTSRTVSDSAVGIKRIWLPNERTSEPIIATEDSSQVPKTLIIEDMYSII